MKKVLLLHPLWETGLVFKEVDGSFKRRKNVQKNILKKKLCKKFGVLEKSITFAPALRDRVGFKEADGSFERRKKV